MAKKRPKKQTKIETWKRLKEELRALLDDPETTRETLRSWEASSNPLTVSQEQRLRGAVRMAQLAVGGQKGLREARVDKVMRLMVPAAADYPLPDGTWVSVVRSEHGWHDGCVEGEYVNGIVTDEEGFTYEINHLRDVYPVPDPRRKKSRRKRNR